MASNRCPKGMDFIGDATPQNSSAQTPDIGDHPGKAIKTILFSLDVEMIILGGSVRHAYPYFEKAMWKQIKTFAFTRALEYLRIEVSTLEMQMCREQPDCAILLKRKCNKKLLLCKYYKWPEWYNGFCIFTKHRQTATFSFQFYLF